MRTRGGTYVAILVSFFVALLLAALPLPQILSYWRPEWAVMVLVFWVLNVPGLAGIGTGFLYGLLVDVLQGTPFGMHSLSLCVVAWAAGLVVRRVSVFSLWQTGGLVLGLVALYLGCNLAILSFLGRAPESLWYWLPALTSALVWPTVMLSLRRYGRRF